MPTSPEATSHSDYLQFNLCIMDYVRIGTTYYKTVHKPLASGDVVELLVPWSTECIRQDHGKHFLSAVPRFNGFCLVPSHLEYKREIENFYNRYHPFLHETLPEML